MNIKNFVYLDKDHPSAPWLLRQDTQSLNQPTFFDGAIFIIFGHDIERVFHRQHIDHLHRDPTSKILLVHDHAPSNGGMYNYVSFIMRKYNLSSSQIILLLMHPSEIETTQKKFKEDGIDIMIVARNQLMIELAPLHPIFPVVETKKFSVLSRALKDWRLKFFFELFNRKLINDCSYSFNNVDPYTHGSPTTIDIKYLNLDLDKWNWRVWHNKADHEIINEIRTWISGMPYEVVGNVLDLTSFKLFNLVRRSHIHIVLESSIHNGWNQYNITEKTYRAIAAQRPFIIYGTVNSLKHLRDCDGFKTFHPFINESYDSEMDNDRRKKMILEEMQRIANLPEFEFLELIENCKSIVLHNYEVIRNYQNFDWPPEFKKLGIL
jgi:hypothetical protein